MNKDYPRICLITGNPGKIKEFSALLGFPLDHEKLDLIEIQALDVKEIAAFKVEQAYKVLKRPVMIDDTGFSVREWHGLPGALITWFLKTVGPEGIIKMAAGLTDRTVDVTTVIGFADESGVQVFSGTVRGKIPPEPRGSGGFGYDSIFIPDGSELTYAEMSMEEKNKVSMRRFAVDDMKSKLFSKQ